MITPNFDGLGTLLIILAIIIFFIGFGLGITVGWYFL